MKRYLLVCIVLFLCIVLLLLSRSPSLPKLKERVFFYLIQEKYTSDDWQNTSVLRKWVASNTPSGSTSLSIRDKLWKKNPLEIGLLYSLRMGGVDCAGYSYTLMKLYREFGYTAYSYHSGKLDGFNHVITLVDIKYHGKNSLVIQDSTFDVTYLDKDGNPLDFFHFLDILAKGELDLIKIEQGDSAPHLYICDLNKKNECRVDSIKRGDSTTFNNRKIYYEKFGTNTVQNNMGIYLIPRILQTMHDKTYQVRTVEELVLYLKNSGK